MIYPNKTQQEKAARKFQGKTLKKGIWKGREVEFAPDEILIKIKPGKERDEIFLKKLFSGKLEKSKLKRKFDKSGIGVIQAGEDIDILKEAATLQELPDIEWAEPNLVDKAAITVPNDPDYGNQWALPQIHAPQAWDLGRGANNVIIAVLDSGIPMSGSPPVLSHPDLNDSTRIILGTDHVNSDATPRDDNGHGTHVAGIASAMSDNATGITGVSWNSRIYVTKIFDANGNGSSQLFYDGVIEAVDYAVAHNLRLVINYSGGGPASNTKELAVQYARDRDCLIVAAAGNDYQGNVIYPAAYSSSYNNVIAVSATDSADAFAPYSNKGPEINVAAPGSHILSTLPNYAVTLNTAYGFSQNYDYLDGTSMAAPHVSGLAALLLSINNALSPDEVRDIIEQTADDLGSPAWDQYYGYGRIDAYSALENIAPPQFCLYLKEHGKPCAWIVEIKPCIYKIEATPCLYVKETKPCAYVAETVPCFFKTEVFQGCIPKIETLKAGPCQMSRVVNCYYEGGFQPGCMAETITIPGQEYIDPREINPATPQLKHITPLTKAAPLSHKRRVYPQK